MQINDFKDLKRIEYSHCYYAQLDKAHFNKIKDDFKKHLKSYKGKYFDLAFMTITKDSEAQSHENKAEVYLMLTDADIHLNGKEFKAKKNDIINIPKNTMHVVHTKNAMYVMANIWDEKPKDVESDMI